MPPCSGTIFPGSTKRGRASAASINGHSRRVLLAEIAKCELVCANCHAVRTYERSTGCSSVWLECRVWDAEVVGSSPTTPTAIHEELSCSSLPSRSVTAGCGGSNDQAPEPARRSPTTPRRRSTTSTAASSTTATRSPSTTSRSRAPANAHRRDARRAAREGAVPGRRLPARDGRRPHRAPRAGDVDGGPWRRGADDHDARAGARRPGRRRRSSWRSARRPSPRSSRRGGRSTCSQSLPQVDDDRIALVGWSSGARVGAIVAGVDRRVKAFDLLSAGSPPVREYAAQAPAELRPAIEQELGAVDPLRWVKLARPGTILLQDGTSDEVVPQGCAGRARGSGRPGRRGALVRPGPCAVERGVGGPARLDGRPARRRRARS